MFGQLEEYGKKITDFIAEAKALIEAVKLQNQTILDELRAVREQNTRIEVAIAALDVEAEETDEEDAEEVTEGLAEEIVEEIAAPVVVEEVVKPEGEIEVIEQEAVPPAVVEEVKEGEEAPLPETPVPNEPAAEPEVIPTEKRSKRFLI